MQKIELIIFYSYFVIWLVSAIVFFINTKFIKDIEKKNKIHRFLVIFNGVAFIVAMNAVFYLWKVPILIRFVFNLFAIVIIILSFKNIKYCQHCGATNQWVMFRKHCSKCGGLI